MTTPSGSSAPLGTTMLMTSDQLRTELQAAYRAIVALGASIDTLTEERDAARAQLAASAELVVAAREWGDAIQRHADCCQSEGFAAAEAAYQDVASKERRLLAALAVQPAESEAGRG